MATGVNVFKSSDASAPTLDGTTGSLCTVLDACLVNGYGSKTAAGTAGSGAWTIAFTGASQRSYRPSAGNRFYMSIIDNGPGAATFQEARIVGYETMSALNTGTNPMPTVAQSANGLFIRKSAAASGVARPWIVVADDRTCYIFIQSGDSANVYLSGMWGDTYSNLSGDGYRTGLFWRVTENSSTTSTTVERLVILATGSSALTGNYVQRSRSGAVGALSVGKNVALSGADAEVTIGVNTVAIAYPNGEDGGLYLTPIFLFDPTTAPASSIRGRLRGVWHCVHATGNFNDGDTFSGVGDFSGKTFLIVKALSTAGFIVCETSDTWDTSS